MGSTGTGHFSDYHSYDNTKTGVEGAGGSSSDDICLKAISTSLEEIEKCDYYINNHNVPVFNTEVSIRFNSRIEAYNIKDNLTLGYLPTKYNYLMRCMTEGVEYRGIVDYSNDKPIAIIKISLTPQHE